MHAERFILCKYFNKYSIRKVFALLNSLPLKKVGYRVKTENLMSLALLLLIMGVIYESRFFVSVIYFCETKTGRPQIRFL